MANETRAQFLPPPAPKGDIKAFERWALQITTILPVWLNNMQQVMLESKQQLYDLGVPRPDDQPYQNAEQQTAYQGSAGIIA